MNPILQNKLDVFLELCGCYKVKSLYSFGSVNTSGFTEHGDIEFIASIEQEKQLLYGEA